MKNFLKALKAAVVGAIATVMVFAFASCGGAGGVATSYANAVKAGNWEKAATYVDGADTSKKDDDKSNDKDDVYAYVYKQSVKSAKVKVEETKEVKETKDEKETVVGYDVKVTVTKNFSYVAVSAKLAVGGLLGGSGASMDEAKAAIKNAKEYSSTITVRVNKTEKGNKLAPVSAAALSAAVMG